MKRFLVDLWDKVLDKLGAFASFVPAVLAQVKIGLAEDDADKIHAHGQELVEAGAALSKLGQSLMDATEPDADGSRKITAEEGSEILLLLENAADELEDVAKGYDEDKTPPVAEG